MVVNGPTGDETRPGHNKRPNTFPAPYAGANRIRFTGLRTLRTLSARCAPRGFCEPRPRAAGCPIAGGLGAGGECESARHEDQGRAAEVGPASQTPFGLGHDVAGVVVRIGSGVESFAPGDEVFARPGDAHIGAFAELIAVPEGDLALKPSTLTMEESAALPLAGLCCVVRSQAMLRRELGPVLIRWPV